MDSSITDQQQIHVREPVPSGEFQLEIEEVRRVGDEVWVLSRLTREGIGTQALTSVSDSVTVNAPDLPQKHFRIGGVQQHGNGEPIPSHDQLTHLDSLQQFHALANASNSELLYSPTDPQLQQWRDSIRERLIAEADERYAGDFGAETDRNRHYYYDGFGSVVGRGTAEDTIINASTTSGTNVQVEGVDEGDIVETDGEFLYMLSGQQLVIVRAVKAAGESPEVVSRTELSYRPHAMFLHDSRLTLIGGDLGGYSFARPGILFAAVDLAFPLSPQRTNISVFDITDRAMPQLTQETVVDGEFVNSRAIGNEVFVVINNRSRIPYLPNLRVVRDGENADGQARYRYQTREEFHVEIDRVVENISPPSAYRRAVSGALERIGWLDSTVFDGNIAAGNGTLTNILKFNTAESDPGPVDNVSVPTGNGWSTQIYASANAIYLLTHEFPQANSGGALLRVSQNEAVTRINKIGIAGDRMTLEASGTVDGTVHDQFSIDEHDGHLRVATTTGALWNQTSENHLFVLEQSGAALTIVGSVIGLAPTEKIYSMRFAGDRAWMVTFRKVDPVFSFDLSDPTQPRVTGELKIPGYSDYLQLIDENHLLAIGRGAIDSHSPRFAWFQEVQVSLFDISDMENPTLLHRYSFEGGRQGQSEALVDHHAFHYIPDRQLLSVPFRNPQTGSWQAGLITLHIDPATGITLRGDIDQPGSVQRSVRIDDLLYAIADQSVSVVSLDSPDSVISSVVLSGNADPDHRHSDLLERYLKKAGNIFFNQSLENRRQPDGRERVDRTTIVGVGKRPENFDGTAERKSRYSYQFRFLNPENGEEVRRVASEEPFLKIVEEGVSTQPSEAATASESAGTVTSRVQVRSRLRGLVNGNWSPWSAVQEFVDGNRPSVTSKDVLTFAGSVLEWAQVRDRSVIDENGNVTLNGVSHSEVYVTNAATRQRVLWDQNVVGSDLNLEQLGPGKFWVWVRSVFEDGTAGEWSEGTAVQILGQKLSVLSSFTSTVETLPQIQWQSLSEAVSFEVEVTTPDGVETFSAKDIAEARLQLPSALSSGSYRFRVRAKFSENGYTEWSDPFAFNVVARPVLNIVGEDINWAKVGDEVFEVWVNNATTGEKILHVKDWTGDHLDNLRERLNLSHGQVDMWIRAILPNGTKTKWSGKGRINLLAEAIQANPVSSFIRGQLQQLSWQQAEGVESVEVYIQKIGEAGAAYRKSGITGLTHELAETLGTGKYRYWMRGALAGGGFTRWGPAHQLSVVQSTVVDVVDRVATWATTADTIRSEVWVNEVNELGRLVRSRVAHATDITGDSFSLEHLPEGNYVVWVQTFRNVAGRLVSDGWSDRLKVSLSDATSVLDVFTNKLDSLLNALDNI